MREFIKEDLEFYLNDKSFKGLSKEYIMEAIFNSDIQKNWKPQVGDVIVGCTGNIFVISGMDRLHQTLGGNRYYFGGSSCNRDGGNVLDSTYCFTANESGDYIHPLNGVQENLYHRSIRDFRYVPYPHERNSKKQPDVSGSLFTEIKILLEKYRDEEMPYWNEPFHYHAEGWAAMKHFVKWLGL